VTTTDARPTCGFCDGSGLWADQDGAPDPCPLCDGAGLVPGASVADTTAARVEAPPLVRARALLPELSAAERQQLYEELHEVWDCRIFRR
jgi:hypothetical protein